MKSFYFQNRTYSWLIRIVTIYVVAIPIILSSQHYFSNFVDLGVGSVDNPKQFKVINDTLFVFSRHIVNQDIVTNSFSSSIARFTLGGEFIDSIHLSNFSIGTKNVSHFQEDGTILIIGYMGDLQLYPINPMLLVEITPQFSIGAIDTLSFSSTNVRQNFIQGLLKFNDSYYTYGSGFLQGENTVTGFIYNWDIDSLKLLDLQQLKTGSTESYVFDLQTNEEGSLVYTNRIENEGSSNHQYVISEIDPAGNLLSEFKSDFIRNSQNIPNLVVLDNGDYVINTINPETLKGVDIKCIGANLEHEKWTSPLIVPFDNFSESVIINSLSYARNGDILGVGQKRNQDNVGWYNSGYIFRMNEEGDILWEHNYNNISDDSTYLTSTLIQVEELANGDLIAIGNNQYVTEENITKRDLWILKTDESGCIAQENCSSNIIVSNNDLFMPEIDVSIKPNPVYNYIHVNLPYDGLYSCFITGINGIEYKFSKISHADKFELNISDLLPGMYILIVIASESKKAISKTFIKI